MLAIIISILFEKLYISFYIFYMLCPGDTDFKAIFSAAATAKALQSCPTLCDPIDGSPPDSRFMGFSRQEHWSGLPLPSPMQESEK